MTIDAEAFERTRQSAAEHLLSQRTPAGHWEGCLASSALSTATAVAALALIDRALSQPKHSELIEDGARWLIEHQNPDGGWGDTVRSFSNISTTMLGWAALGRDEVAGAADAERIEQTVRRAEGWLGEHAGSLEVPALVGAVMRRYGKDRTFSVPILTMCALCGRLGDPAHRTAWRWVMQLPFELAAFPQEWFRFLRLPVVSYALPALIAIGRVRHARRPTWNPLTLLLRGLAKRRTMRVLERIQPSNGGFLEATPLTSFVTMSLAGCGLADHPVAERGVGFIEHSARADGSWPIDTNLATWVTTLSVNALAAGGRLEAYLDEGERRRLQDWLLDQQYTEVHPYTNAPPGGWAWTPLPGGVPDADDTSGALAALANLGRYDTEPPSADADPEQLRREPDTEAGRHNARLAEAVRAGNHWLEGLRNGDGGIPTFCRGWGKLAFDRSSADITAHLIRARAEASIHLAAEPDRAQSVSYLRSQQRENGAWNALWFGNQHLSDESNPTYGTSRCVLALARRLEVLPENSSDVSATAREMMDDGVRWLLDAQGASGGWGGGVGAPPSIEETALAVEALGAVLGLWVRRSVWPEWRWEGIAEPAELERIESAVEAGTGWLIERTEGGTAFEPSPIGFYFAKLWYFERLYPVVWTVAALERVGAWLEYRQQAAAAAPAEGAAESGA